MEEGLGAGTCDKAGAKFGVEESTADEVGSVEGGGGARSSGVGDRREKSGVFEGEDGIRIVREGLANARETSGREEDIEAAIVVGGGGEIEAASAMLGPRLAGEGRIKGNDKLARGVNGMGGKVVGGTMKAMVGRERRVERPRAEMVEGKLGLWEQVVPPVRGEGDVGDREDSDEMVFGGKYGTFRRE